MCMLSIAWIIHLCYYGSYDLLWVTSNDKLHCLTVLGGNLPHRIEKRTVKGFILYGDRSICGLT